MAAYVAKKTLRILFNMNGASPGVQAVQAMCTNASTNAFSPAPPYTNTTQLILNTNTLF